MSYGDCFIVFNPRTNQVELTTGEDHSMPLMTQYIVMPGNTSLLVDGLHHIQDDNNNPKLRPVSKDKANKLLTDWVVDSRVEGVEKPTYKAILLEPNPKVYYRGINTEAMWVTMCVCSVYMMFGKGTWGMGVTNHPVPSSSAVKMSIVEEGFKNENQAMKFMADWMQHNRQQAVDFFDLDILEACL